MLSDQPFRCPPELLAKTEGGEPIATVIAGAAGDVALESARQATAHGLIRPLLVGERAGIERSAEAIGWDLSGLEIISAEGEADTARKAVALARSGRAQALMKGQIHTDHLMRAVVNRDEGLRTERRLSHLFYMTIGGRPGALSITDAAVNVAPSPDQRLDILCNAVALHRLALGQERPRVAVLSATETPIPAMPSSQEAAEIAERAAAGAVPDAEVEGPLSLDLAVSPQAAAVKGLEGKVAGRADILLVPNIETGNALFKAMVYFMSATAAGIVLGARVPIVLTSRADPPEARLAGIALAFLQAQVEGS